MIQLNENELLIVKNILKMHVPNARIMIFGSRTGERFKPHSDLDLAIDAHAELSITTMTLLADDFEKSLLPFRVDISDWHKISLSFQNTIHADCEILSLD